MKNKFNLIGLIVIIAVTAFSFAACDGLFGPETGGCGCCVDCTDTCKGNCCANCKYGSDPGVTTQAINVTVTGDFSNYVGWKAGVQLGSPDPNVKGALAYSNYVTISSANSLSFPLFTNSTRTTPFTTEGNYFIAFWFEKDGEEDADYYIVKQLTKGVNTITFASFIPMQGNEVPITLTVTNNTGFEGHRLYVDLSSEPEFTADRLGATEFFENGSSKTITLQAAGSYDMRIITANSNVYTKYNVDVTSNMTVTFTDSDLDSVGGDDDFSDLYGSWIKDLFYEDARLTLVISESYLGFVSESIIGGGISYSFDIISYKGTTMTLDDYEGPFTIEVYINSDGKIVISGFEFHDGTYTNEDDYIYEEFTPPDTATFIMEGRWYRRSFSSLDNAPQWFTFDAEAGETYRIYINDTDWIDDFELTDVAMNIYFNGEKFYNVDLIPDFESFFEFDAVEDGTVYVNVIRLGSENWGKFDIGYNSIGGRGELIWQLSESFWISGNFNYDSEIGYVIEAQAGVTYSIWLDDKDKTSSKIDARMTVGFVTYDVGDKGTIIIEEEDIYSFDYTPDVKCRLYVMITPYDSNDKDGDNFEVVFTTDGKNPGKG